jgi:hypothetical protein
MPTHAVKGIIGAREPPPEARVSRLDECRLKQKVGYGQDANPILLPEGGVSFFGANYVTRSWGGGGSYVYAETMLLVANRGSWLFKVSGFGVV